MVTFQGQLVLLHCDSLPLQSLTFFVLFCTSGIAPSPLPLDIWLSSAPGRHQWRLEGSRRERPGCFSQAPLLPWHRVSGRACILVTAASEAAHSLRFSPHKALWTWCLPFALSDLQVEWLPLWLVSGCLVILFTSLQMVPSLSGFVFPAKMLRDFRLESGSYFVHLWALLVWLQSLALEPSINRYRSLILQDSTQFEGILPPSSHSSLSLLGWLPS